MHTAPVGRNAPRSKPQVMSCCNHWQSSTSDLRPETFLTWRALTRNTLKPRDSRISIKRDIGQAFQQRQAHYADDVTHDHAIPRAICTIAIPVFRDTAFHFVTFGERCVSSARFAAQGRFYYANHLLMTAVASSTPVAAKLENN